MENIVLNRNQTKAIAQAIYGDVKSYCQKNIDRYVSWYIDESRKSKGKSPLKPLNVKFDLCAYCDHHNPVDDTGK